MLTLPSPQPGSPGSWQAFQVGSWAHLPASVHTRRGAGLVLGAVVPILTLASTSADQHLVPAALGSWRTQALAQGWSLVSVLRSWR